MYVVQYNTICTVSQNSTSSFWSYFNSVNTIQYNVRFTECWDRI